MKYRFGKARGVKRVCRRGSALLTVVVLTAVAAILLTSVMTAVISANAVSAQNWKAQQAYFAARSAVNAVAAYICDPENADSVESLIPKDPDDPPVVSDGNSGGGLGWYRVFIKNVTPKESTANKLKIEITAVGYYPDKESGVSRTVSRRLERQSAERYFDNLLYLNTSDEVTFGECELHGNIVTNKSLSFGQSTKIYGDILCGGDLTINGAGEGIGNVESIGNIKVSGSGTIASGDVSAGGDVSITGDGEICGNLGLNGNLLMDGSGKIDKNVTAGGNVTLSGNPRIKESLNAGGAFNYPKWGSPSTFVLGTCSANSPVDKITVAPPEPITTVVGPPSRMTDPPLYEAVTLLGKKIPYQNKYSSALINQDGTLYSNDNLYFTYGGTLNVDTTEKDINLRLGKSADWSCGMTINVEGSHNLYIWLEDGVSLTLRQYNFTVSNPKKNEDEDARIPQIFIIGGKGSSLTLHNSNIEAYVYMPTGTFTMDGVSTFNGSVIAKDVNLNGSITLNHKKPDLEGSILDEALSSWALGNWKQGSLPKS